MNVYYTYVRAAYHNFDKVWAVGYNLFRREATSIVWFVWQQVYTTECSQCYCKYNTTTSSFMGGGVEKEPYLFLCAITMCTINIHNDK